MKLTLTALAAALLGAAVTFVITRPEESIPQPPLKTAALPPAGPEEDQRVEALTREVAELKARLAAEEKPAPVKAVQETDPAQQAREREARMAQRREAMKADVAARVERLTVKLALQPEQAAAVTAWHEAHGEQVLAARMKTPADPKDYRLRMAYRQDLPPETQASLTPEQQELWQKHDADSRADSVESITNAEMGFIAGTLDLSRDQKDQLFPHLSQLYMEDTYADFTNVTDLESLAAQKDADNERRRRFYSEIFDAAQMEKWESVAASYRENMLQQYGAPKQ